MSNHDPDRRRLLISTATLAALPLAAATTAAPGNPITEPQEETEPNAWPGGPDDANITPAIIAAAERLAGIKFTEEERTTIAATVGEQMAIFAARVDAGAMPNDTRPGHGLPRDASGSSARSRDLDGKSRTGGGESRLASR